MINKVCLSTMSVSAITLTISLAILANSGCSSHSLKYAKEDQLKENQEFSQRVKITEAPDTAASENVHKESTISASPVVPPPPGMEAVTKAVTKASAKKNQKKSKSSKTSLPTMPSTAVPVGSEKRQPELEGNVGFQGRRPLVDPFRVGEVVVHNVNYLKMTAGSLRLETRPFADVNGRKNYQFRTTIKTTSVFNSFYTVHDFVDVLMDFEQMIPSVFTLHVKESNQLKEAQMFFDHEKNTATYWEKKVTDKDGEENKKQQWEIEPFSQNVFSAAFYMRVFQWQVGKEVAFRVADDNQNLVFRAKALRKERLVTAAGEFDAIVIRPEFELQGKFKPTGDNYIWLSDDDRKFILRIESKIKIGSLISEIVELHPGH